MREALPFGVGGGLVAIKTLLGRDPCVHANTAIEMIDAILKEHPAAPEPVCKECNGSGEIETGIGMMACTDCPPAAQHEPENEPYVSLASVQEPVAWAVVGEGEWGEWVIGQQFETNNPPNHEYWKNRGYLLVPLYTTPPAQPAPVQPVAGLYAVLFVDNWDGEGDQEYVFAELSEDGVWTRYENGSLLFEYKGDKIISAWPLSEATQPAAQPAPVQQVAATITISRRGAVNTIDNHFEDCVRDWPDGEYKLVLATPPAAQRQWVGLTQEERLHFLNEILDYGTGFVAPLDSVIWSIEAKLKEKNA